jgi:hypothetical protein
MAREMENLQCVAEGAIFREISYWEQTRVK